MQPLFSNPPVLEDFLNREIGAIDRLVDGVLARNTPKKPCHRVGREEMEFFAPSVRYVADSLEATR